MIWCSSFLSNYHNYWVLFKHFHQFDFYIEMIAFEIWNSDQGLNLLVIWVKGKVYLQIFDELNCLYYFAKWNRLLAIFRMIFGLIFAVIKFMMNEPHFLNLLFGNYKSIFVYHFNFFEFKLVEINSTEEIFMEGLKN